MDSTPSKVIRVILADDNELARAGARCLLAQARDIQIVGEAADGIEALRLAEKSPTAVVLLDMHLPGLDGPALLRRLALGHQQKSLVLVGGDEGTCMVEALGQGASGFLCLPQAASQLVEAVRSVANGGNWLKPPLCATAFECASMVAKAVGCDPYHSLTDREREVLRLAAQGDTNTVIGKRLFISPRTVEIHRSRAMKKLGLVNMSEMVRFALRRGIITMEE